MSRLGAEAWLVAAAIWVSIMLPSAAFGAAADEGTHTHVATSIDRAE